MTDQQLRYKLLQETGLSADQVDQVVKTISPYIEKLESQLDDIDTAGDLFKPEIDRYFKYVSAKIQGMRDGGIKWTQIAVMTQVTKDRLQAIQTGEVEPLPEEIDKILKVKI